METLTRAKLSRSQSNRIKQKSVLLSTLFLRLVGELQTDAVEMRYALHTMIEDKIKNREMSEDERIGFDGTKARSTGWKPYSYIDRAFKSPPEGFELFINKTFKGFVKDFAGYIRDKDPQTSPESYWFELYRFNVLISLCVDRDTTAKNILVRALRLDEKSIEDHLSYTVKSLGDKKLRPDMGFLLGLGYGKDSSYVNMIWDKVESKINQES